MLVWAFVVRTCMLHKALIRLRGCTCLSGLLLYVHVCYIRRWSDCADAHACLCFCFMYMYASYGADKTVKMHMLVCAFVVHTCMLQWADLTARMHMLVSAFVVRTCILHKALIRLRGYTCLSGLLLYVHVCYIGR